jgi:hypothetical protein
MSASFQTTLSQFLSQAQTKELKTSSYSKEYMDLKVRISFGMGAPARIPWIAFITNDMQVSNGFYPCYLYYKEEKVLVLSYGVSETNEFENTWPNEVIEGSQLISEYFNKKVARYGGSYVFKAYQVNLNKDDVELIDTETKEIASEEQIDNDLRLILDKYKQCFDVVEQKQSTGEVGIGLFYMEKQLEDFLIQNWENTDLGKRMDLIIEEGELISQQYRTDIGPIDILAKDKQTGNYVVIELKKNQTSDDTVGQIARYMGWVQERLNGKDVKGIIISGANDKKLEYAAKMFPQVEVYTYSIDFKLRKS